MPITKVTAIKQYFGKEKPVTIHELMELRKADPKGYDELAQEAAKQLGETLE